jgi:molybdenum cofactor cytidylyltransferase
VNAVKIGAVILAAGEGARLGGVAKALIQRDGETFLARIVRTAREVGLADAVVVVGPPFADAVASAARDLGARIAVNEAPSRGMASSVALGFAAMLDTDVEAAWLWPVDHPMVRAPALERVVAAGRGCVVAKPSFGGRHGHPPLVARSLFAALALCANEPGGARAVLARVTHETAIVDVDDEAILEDVDEA